MQRRRVENIGKVKGKGTRPRQRQQAEATATTATAKAKAKASATVDDNGEGKGTGKGNSEGTGNNDGKLRSNYGTTAKAKAPANANVHARANTTAKTKTPGSFPEVGVAEEQQGRHHGTLAAACVVVKTKCRLGLELGQRLQFSGRLIKSCGDTRANNRIFTRQGGPLLSRQAGGEELCSRGE